jgi:Ca-activated chloride channel homolog
MSAFNRASRRVQMPFVLFFVFANILATVALAACDSNSDTPTEPSNAVEVTFAYSSEKQPWIDPLATKFNGERHTLPGSNQPIYIKAFVVDSGTARSKIVDKTLQPVVWSPSNSLWKSVLNFEADQELGGSGPGDADPLLLNPVVIAMWRPMAEALGWPSKPIGLKDILDLNANPQGWGAFGHPEWGPFK